MFSKNMATSLILFIAIIVCSSASAQVDPRADWAILLKQSDALNKARNTDSAFVLAKQAAEVARASNGDRDSSVAMSLHKVSAIAWQLFLPETDSLFKLALAAWDKVENANQLERAKTLSNYGGMLANTPPYLEGIPILNECLAIRKRLLPPYNIDIARTEIKLAQALMNAGRPGDAIQYCDEAARILAVLPNTSPLQKREPYNVAGMSYYLMGQFDRAEENYRTALKISVDANDSNWTAIFMSKLAAVFTSTKRYASADSICRAGLEYIGNLDSTSQDRTRWAAISELHNSRGLALWQSKDFDRAESSFVNSLKIKQYKVVSADKGEILRVQYTLANLYRDSRKLAAAESLYVEVLKERRKILGDSHRDIAYSLYSLGRLYVVQGRVEEAFDTTFAACQMRSDIIDRQAAVLTETDLLDYSTQIREAANQCLSIAAASESVRKSRANQIAEVILRTKGFVSDHVFRREFVKGKPDESHSTNLLSSVSKQIPKSTTLLEYFRYGHSDFSEGATSDSSRYGYAVLVLASNSNPTIAFLGTSDETDSLVVHYQQHLSSVSGQGHLPTAAQTEEFAKLTGNIYQLAIAPIVPALKTPALLISPDGSLNNVAFGTLVDESGKFLVESYSLHYLSAGRDIVRSSNGRKVEESMFAFADPDFDAPPDQRINRPEQAAVGTALASGKVSSRRALDDCLYTRGITVDKLASTRLEVAAVCSKWEVITKRKSSQYFGAIASEDNFKSKTAGASVIYVATHGFYVDSLCASQVTDTDGKKGRKSNSERMLAQSGFLLSGANRFGKESYEAGVEDGVVSAAEIAEMNFSHSPIVVLSACESALGRIRNGEGVYGLRRAFLLAGARTVLSALWKIDDESTAEMMSQLFSSDSANLPERIRSLQLAQIAKQRAENRPVHPYTWGAFIATGDWR